MGGSGVTVGALSSQGGFLTRAATLESETEFICHLHTEGLGLRVGGCLERYGW